MRLNFNDILALHLIQKIAGNVRVCAVLQEENWPYYCLVKDIG